MRHEFLLAGAIGVLALSLGVGAIAVPGVLSSPSEDVRESYLTVQQPYVEATNVTGETVTLSLDSRLEHRGGPAGNVTVVTRAIDTETGLVETTARQSLGTVTGDRDVQYNTTLSVEREGGYRIVTEVFAGGREVTSHRGTVSNLDALVPVSSRSSVGFHEYDDEASGVSAINYRIERVENNESTLNVTVDLTNTGDDAAGGLELQIRARQADSNVIADASTVEVGQIRPGRTRTVSTEITVPDGYDYWLDGILRSDDVIVATESSVADLDPTETLQVNQTRTETGFQSSDFTEAPDAEDMDGQEPQADDQQTAVSGSGPGFTAGIALVAVALAALLGIRRET